MENMTADAVPETEQRKAKAPEKQKAKAVKKPRGKAAKALRIIAILLVLALLATAVYWFLHRRAAAADSAAEISYVTVQAEKGSVTTSLSGSGTLEPANSYTVTTLVEGEVVNADFEEGDHVTADTILYTIDSSDAATGTEKAQLSLEQAQNSYDKAISELDKLNVKASAAGTIIELDVAAGDEIGANQTVAVIRDSSVMTLKVDFPADDAKGFYVGQWAVVTLDGSLESMPGTISKVSAVDNVLSTGQIVRQVTIDVKNPGGIAVSRVATAVVAGIESMDSGEFSYKTEKTIMAGVSGTVSAIKVAEGDTVKDGQVLATLTSDSLSDAVDNAYQNLRNAQLSLDNQNDTLDNYTITSPIDGTIIDKYYKAGDKVSSGRSMCLIYDLSYLTLSLNVDELDISQVQVGQTAAITADAVEGKTYEGVVTKVSVAGTTSGGVTTYPVTIRVDETDGLLPGMNVDAKIIVDSVEDVIVIPSQAVERRNRVLVTSDSPSAANALEDQAPDGYVYVEVTTGLSDDSNVAILSGLQEGDTVAYAVMTAPSDDTTTGGFGMFGGNSNRGTAPSGEGGYNQGNYSGGNNSGFSGGAPSGGSAPSGGGMPGGN